MIKTDKKTDRWLEAGKAYLEICRASTGGAKRGLNVGEFRKKYKLKPSGVMPMLEFIRSQFDSDISTIKDFSVYKICNDIKKYEGIPFNELDADDYEELDISAERVGDEYFIYVDDEISLLIARLKKEDCSLDIRNAAMLSNLKGKLGDLWNKISEQTLDSKNIIFKSREAGNREKENKARWINAAIRGKAVECHLNGVSNIIKETVRPLGIYYDKCLDTYFCVYRKNDGTVRHCELWYIYKVILDEKSEAVLSEFNIRAYMKSICTERVTLKVFKEAKVLEKLKRLLEENELTTEEFDDYCILRFKVYEPYDYINIFNGYGRSVVILEPKYLHDRILKSTEDALTYYTKEGSYENIKG